MQDNDSTERRKSRSKRFLLALLLPIAASSWVTSGVQSSWGQVWVGDSRIPTQNGQRVVGNLFKATLGHR